MSAWTATGDDEADWELRDMAKGLSSEREQCHRILITIQCLVSRVRLLVPDNSLHFVRIAACSLHECLTLIDRSCILINKRDDVGLKERSPKAGILYVRD